MKTLKTLSVALLILLSFNAVAADETGKEKLNVNYALATYIDAVTHGNIKGLAEVLDKDVKFTSMRGEQIINHNKAQVLSLLKHSENAEQNCSTVYSIIESNQTLSVVKIVMDYPEFSKVTYLNIVNTFKGWKITNVSSSYN